MRRNIRTKKKSVKKIKRISLSSKKRKLVSPSLRLKSNLKDQKELPKIYVINLKKDKTKFKKYQKDYNQGLIERYSACLGVDPQTKYKSQFKENEKKLQIMWNAGEKKKKCTAGILTSHLGVIKKVYKSKSSFPSKGVLIIEDDAQINFPRLKRAMKKINKYKDSIIYFGGTLHPPDTFKNKTWYNNIDKLRNDFKKDQFNVIDPTKYRILGGHGYYFPTWETVDGLLKKIDIKKKLRALDSEMVKLQKSKFIKYFYYPAISYLNIEDAKKGIHAGYFDDKRTMEFY
tara:strand:+ start:21860 stop:22720 length:861 start_codon:yes stop_codon:yes gene_type:complete